MAKKTKSTRTKSTGTVQVNLSKPGSFFDMGFDFGGRGRPNKPYRQVEWVWLCVNKIIDVCTDIQMLLTTTDDKIIESGPVYDFFFSRKESPFYKFISETVGYYALFREVYWIFTDKDGISPRNLIVAGPDTCKPEVINGVVVGYKYYPSGSGQMIPLFLEDVWPITNFNPDVKYEGVGPTKAGEVSISANHQATLYNEAVFRNGAKPGTLLVAPQGVKLDDAERRALKSEFDDVHMGARNAGKTFLATGGLDVKTFGQTMAELQMVDLRKYDAATICAMFGVPMSIVNLNPEAQYAHGPDMQRFIIYTISPILSLVSLNITLGILYNFRFKSFGNKAVDVFESKLYCGQRVPLNKKESYRRTKFKAIQSNQNLFAYFDIESHPAIQEMQREKTEKVLKYTTNGVPLNQVIDAYDLPFDTTKIPWGDDWWVGMGQVPARYTLEAGPEALLGPPLPEGRPAGEEEEKPEKNISVSSVNSVAETEKDERQRLRIWKNWVISWAGIEREYTGALRTLFVRQQRLLIDRLTAAFTELKTQNSKLKTNDDEIIARVVFDLQKESDKITAINHTFFDKASELGIRQIAAEAGLSAEALNQFVETAKRSYAIRRSLIIQSQTIKGVNKTTQRMVANSLREGLKAGEGLPDLTNRVKEVLGFNRTRAQGIARSYTGSAISSGRHEGIKKSGFGNHAWLDAHDNNVRELHKDAGKRYAVPGIPIDEAFIVGGDALMHPGDPSASIANTANCRCVELPAKSDESKTIIFARYANLKFLSYEDMESIKCQTNSN